MDPLVHAALQQRFLRCTCFVRLPETRPSSRPPDFGCRSPVDASVEFRNSSATGRTKLDTTSAKTSREVESLTPAFRATVQRFLFCRWGDRRNGCPTACWRTWAALPIATQAHSLVPDPREMTGPPTVIEISDPFPEHVAREFSKTPKSGAREHPERRVAGNLHAERKSAASEMRDDGQQGPEANTSDCRMATRARSCAAST